MDNSLLHHICICCIYVCTFSMSYVEKTWESAFITDSCCQRRDDFNSLPESLLFPDSRCSGFLLWFPGLPANTTVFTGTANRRPPTRKVNLFLWLPDMHHCFGACKTAPSSFPRKRKGDPGSSLSLLGILVQGDAKNIKLFPHLLYFGSPFHITLNTTE